jgi:hypothetical protein
MFDFIPLRRARRIVMDLQCQAGLIGELLEFHFPEPTCIVPIYRGTDLF